MGYRLVFIIFFFSQLEKAPLYHTVLHLLTKNCTITLYGIARITHKKWVTFIRLNIWYYLFDSFIWFCSYFIIFYLCHLFVRSFCIPIEILVFVLFIFFFVKFEHLYTFFFKRFVSNRLCLSVCVYECERGKVMWKWTK